MTVDITAAANGSSLWYWAWEEHPHLSVFNAGSVSATEADAALVLTAPSVTYVGSSNAFISRLGGTALQVSALAGQADITVEHDIDAGIGIFVTADSTGTHAANIMLSLGTTTASGTGVMLLDNGSGVATISIAKGARIVSPSGLWVSALGGAKVILAGEIVGPPDLAEPSVWTAQASQLGSGDDELELHPGYRLEGTIDGDAGTNTISFGGAGAATFDLADLGTKYLSFQNFSKSGTSTWTLDGAATQRFDLDIMSGAVDFRGSLAVDSTFMVRSEARLSGDGVAGDLDVWGTLAPGAQGAGTLYAGDAVFHPGSFFEIETTATSADQLTVGSASILGGTVRIIPSAGSLASYDILVSAIPLTANDRFDNVLSTNPRYSAILDYADPSKVVLLLTHTGVTFSSYAKTPQQAAVAALLDAMGENAPYYQQLDVMAPEAAAALLEQLAGLDFAATQGALLNTTAALNAASLGRIQQQSGTIGPSPALLGYSTFTRDDWTDGLHPTAWGRLIAGTSTIGGSVSGSTALVGGVDVELGDAWTLGLLAGIGSSAINSTTTSTNSVDLSAGLYGATEFSGFALRFGASITHHSVASTRKVEAPGVNETFMAAYGAATAQGFVELARQFHLGPVDVELFGDLGYARHVSPGFTETGGAGALTVAASSSDAVDTVLGVRAGRKLAMGTRLLTAGLTLAWKHRFAATPSTTNSMAGGAPFEVAGVSAAGSSLMAAADLRIDLDERSGLELAYSTEWGSSGFAHQISGRYASRF